MIQVYTNNSRIDELDYMFAWCLQTFGDPTEEDMRWTYGRDLDWTGNDRCNGTFDIGWFKFSDEQDAIVFKLKFGL